MRYSKHGISTLTSTFPLSSKTTALLKRRKGYEKGNISKIYGVQSIPKLVRLIFFDFMKIVMTRVANGDTFVLPGSNRANITLKKYRKSDVLYMLGAGKLQNLDLPKMGYVMPYFALDFGPTIKRRDARIAVPQYMHDMAFKSVEERRIPWVYFRKTYNENDYRYRGDPR